MAKSSSSLAKDKKRKKLLSDPAEGKKITEVPPNNDPDRKGRSSRSEADREHTESSSEQDSALAYVLLSREESEQMLLMNVSEIESQLRDKFHLDAETNLKDAAVLDYYVGATYWGQQQGYNIQQLSILFTIVHTLLNKVKDEQVLLVGLIRQFREMIATTCRQTQTPGETIFSIEQSKAITDYLSSSLFQHYRLYEYLFSVPQDEEIVSKDFSVEVPVPEGVPFPKSLDEGLPEEILTSIFAVESLQPAALTERLEDTEMEQAKPDIPTEIELPPNVSHSFEKLTPEDVKAVISEVCTALLTNLEKTVETKITQQEETALAKINMVHNVVSSCAKYPDGKN